MTALLAVFVSLFVLVSAVDAATCSPEAAASHASTVAAADLPGDQDNGGGPDNHAICSHGHCHHAGVAVAQTPETPTVTPVAADLNAQPMTDGPPSRKPSGPDRPPRG